MYLLKKKLTNAVKFFDGTTPWNNGFFIMNISRYRNGNFQKTLLEKWLPKHNETHPIWKFGSQPLMELLFFGRWIHMNTSWYCLGLGVGRPSKTLEELVDGGQLGCPIESAKTGAVLHWNGINKPWKDEGTLKGIWKKHKPMCHLTGISNECECKFFSFDYV